MKTSTSTTNINHNMRCLTDVVTILLILCYVAFFGFILKNWPSSVEISIPRELHLGGDDSGAAFSNIDNISLSASSATVRRYSKKNQEDLPFMIIHVGPPKTGTASIQAFLGKNQKIMKENDSYDASLHRGSGDEKTKLLHFFRVCLLKKKHCSKKYPFTWSKWLTLTRNLGHRNGNDGRGKMNVVISDEAFAVSDFDDKKNINWQEFLSFHKDHYQIKFVMYYRRYFDWLLSHYNQYSKPSGWFPKKKDWPQKGGVRPHSFESFYDKRPDRKKYFFKDRETGKFTLPTWLLKQSMDRLSLSYVPIGNFHNNDVVEDFICNRLPFCNHTCDMVKKQRNKSRVHKNKSNGYAEISYDLIAVAAKESGLLNKSISRYGFLTYMIEQKFNKFMNLTMVDTNNFPLVCMGREKLEDLRKTSYDIEKELMPSMLPTHDDDFWKAVERKKFCSVDTEKVLEDEKWKNLFSKML